MSAAPSSWRPRASSRHSSRASGHPGRADHDHRSVRRAARQVGASRGAGSASSSPGGQVAGSILGLDITGEDVDDTGLVWDTGDADMTARPIARHADARAVARRAHRSAHAHHVRRRRARRPRRIRATRWCASWSGSLRAGMTPVVACELEFYLLKEGAGGALAPAGGGRASERQKIDAYSLTRLDDLAPLFDDVYPPRSRARACRPRR